MHVKHAPPATPRSLGHATELALVQLDGVVEEFDDHWLVRTPTSPDFYWGNYLLLKHAPRGENDACAWLDHGAAMVRVVPIHGDRNLDAAPGQRALVMGDAFDRATASVPPEREHVVRVPAPDRTEIGVPPKTRPAHLRRHRCVLEQAGNSGV